LKFKIILFFDEIIDTFAAAKENFVYFVFEVGITSIALYRSIFYIFC